MKHIVLLLLLSLSAIRAEDPWANVRLLQSGSELRIYKVHEREPVAARLEHAGDDSVVVVTKKAQLSIPKEDVERIDCRVRTSSRLSKGPRIDRKVTARGAEITNNTIPGATTSVSTGLQLPKPGFETVYRRVPAR